MGRPPTRGAIGDRVVIMAFAQMEEKEAESWKPKVLVLSEKNSRVLRADNVLIAKIFSL